MIMTYENATGYKIRNQTATHFLTFTIEGWMDIFSRQIYRDIIIDSFQYCREKKGLKIGAFVIMTNHMHVIWTAANGNLSDIVRDFKTFTSKAVSKAIAEENESRKQWLLYMLQFLPIKQQRMNFIKCGPTIITLKKYTARHL
jgi:REP element-mobilizing transposase RayT